MGSDVADREVSTLSFTRWSRSLAAIDDVASLKVRRFVPAKYYQRA